ncbi:SDR family NAD(P)-dependent oxidoreductase [Scytonema sp. UIC 10036]|uniref:SDR family oxidoreductase n=1 Tax=Scytonema sp. UIC 10036 TaxID=2304196 RepID=UPI0012DA0414|nr:SDR family oxidoreductase [Scytonema sp. UIC 10036]MUG93351.1 SDR family NAD(P)-dependent oxidoreductase [Scytonema sp. UIC 10036]
MQELQGKVVLVTGGGRGLGEATCQTLSSAGASVVVADIRDDLANKVSGEIQSNGFQAQPLVLDVTNEEQVETAIHKIVSQYGRLDALINNAGTDVTVSIEELSIKDWDRILAVNLRAPFIMSKFALPVMKEQKSGHIINISSTAAKRAWPNASAYHASKWGLLGFSHALHVEARPYNIKVTALVAGGMETPFLLDRFPDIDVSKLQNPKNVAATIRFLLSTPEGTVIPEMMVLPMAESSWP